MAAALKNLQDLHAQKKLANVYLILPPCGAAEGAMSLWGQKLALHIHTWEKSKSSGLGHSDMLVIRPEEGRANYVVQDFEEYFRELNYRPGQWGFRYIIIESADRIPTVVANKLLMSLEFSPPWCVHFLLCDSTRPLLPTVESRAVNINLSPEDLTGSMSEDGKLTIKPPQDLQDLLKDIQKNTEAARRWESDLLNLILQHANFDQGDNSLLLCKILSRNVTSSAFKNPAYERIVPLWHLLKSLENVK
ncbi:MAG: hypothetical protein A2X86_20985 [Bdellovibrionales bacterium GWA2_49_15]|nr:MAG: hypothetical protein A2X86_20985 [Bdellovibrionales bacterium GWA2_49_15]HAZ14854.1 hypothetical protein [Bdellovibrionales bacterium]